MVAVVADEVAFWRDESIANPDAEIIAALRPGMATVPGALLLGISSPYSRRGVLWDAHRRHYGQDDSDVLIWQADSASMNPTIDPAVIARAYEEDEASASAEFGGTFRRDIEGFVSREAVDAVVEDFADTLRRYRIGQVRGDRYGAEWVAEAFRKAGITYRAAEKPKSDLYRELLPAIHSQSVELLDHPNLIAQLCQLERRTARGGRDSIDHPPRAHDDLANAVAGAVQLVLGRGRGPTPFDLFGGPEPHDDSDAGWVSRNEPTGIGTASCTMIGGR
jgi:hypothetical protein